MRNEADSLPKAMYLFTYCFPRQNLSGRKYVDLCLCLLMAFGFLEVDLVTMAILNQHTFPVLENAPQHYHYFLLC